MSTHNVPFSIHKKNHPKLTQICSYMYAIFSEGHKNEFETAVVNEPSVFEPLKVYSITLTILSEISCESDSLLFAKSLRHNICHHGQF